METSENDSYFRNETSIPEEITCDGVLNLEGLTFPVNSTYWEETLELFYGINHHYQEVPAWVFVVLLVIGFAGNVVNVFVFSRPFMRTPINFLLCSLEFVNVFLFATFIPDLIRYFNPVVTVNLGMVVVDIVVQVLETAVVCCSNWLTVAVGVWRYVAITWPLNVDSLCNKNKTKWTIGVIVVASAAITAPGAFLRSLEYAEFNVTYQSGTTNEFSEIRRIYKARPSQYSCSYPSMKEVANGLILLTTSIPCFTLALVTVFLLRGLWRAKRARERMIRAGSTYKKGVNQNILSNQLNEKRITVILIFLVFLFFLAYLPDAVLNVMVLARIETYNKTIFYELLRTRVFILVCNCLTFFIYLVMSERYRDALFSSFKKFKTELSKVSSGSRTSSSSAPSVLNIPLGHLSNEGPVS